MLTVLCATLGDESGQPKRLPRGMQFLGPVELRLSTAKPWATAANELLDYAAAKGGPALFLDDDIELTRHSFDWLMSLSATAAPDVAGFTLCNGDQIVSAGFAASVQTDDMVLLQPMQLPYILQPFRCAHVTASCMWLSERALQRLRFPVWPGQHHEDVAFTLEAWLQGLTVAYVPGLVFHHIDMQHMAGATKAKDPQFAADRAVNAWHLREWIRERGVAQALRDGRIPVGVEPL